MLSNLKLLSKYKHTIHIIIAGSISFACIGTATGWATPSLEKLSSNSTIPLTNDELSWIASMIGIGGPVSAILCAYFLNKIGRKPVLLAVSLAYLIGFIIIIFANSAFHFYIGRFFSGMGAGGTFCTIPLYIGEMIDPKMRGCVFAWISIFMSFSTIIIFIVGSLYSLLTLNIVCTVFPILMFSVVLFAPETPFFLMKIGKKEEATKCMMKLKGCHHVSEIESDLKNMEKFMEDNGNCNFMESVKHLKEPRSVKAIIIITVLLLGQQFCGVTALCMYMAMIFENSDIPLDSMYAIVISEIVGTIAMFIFSTIVDKFGRKPIYMCSAVLTISFQMLLGSYFLLKTIGYIGNEYSVVVMILMYLLRFGYELGVSPIPTVIVSEILSFNIRGIVGSYFAFVQGIVLMTGVKLFQIITDSFGQHYAHWTFGCFLVCPMIFIAIYMPETKNKTFVEIQNDLDGKSKKEKLSIKYPDNDSGIYRIKETI